ncbi:MAG: hypothetical protein HUJ30_04730, partial [Gammaproteobacteria bacterium]|nr:hypothetical protein [Gammaproteobacteria bacterium]
GTAHPMAGEAKIGRDELGRLSFVLRERNAAIREHIQRVMDEEMLTRLDVVMEVGSTDAIIDILHRGRHMSFLPRFAVMDAVQDGSLKSIEVEGVSMTRTLWIARNRMNQQHPVAEAFIDMLKT